MGNAVGDHRAGVGEMTVEGADNFVTILPRTTKEVVLRVGDGGREVVLVVRNCGGLKAFINIGLVRFRALLYRL
jgi:hypothetical protein